MKACVLAGPRPVASQPLSYSEVSDPRPGEGQVLVRVRACAVCRTDRHILEGELPPRRTPLIPGHQVVGTIDARGRSSKRYALGTRVGVPWLHRTCGICPFCARGMENLCDDAVFTGYTVDGGFAEYMLADENFIYELPPGVSDVQAAPLLCAGIVGFRALRQCGVPAGGALGLYGFGAAGHVVIQVARHWNISVYVCTRDYRHRRLARELGAVWAGAVADPPPRILDAAIIFAPAGELVPPALSALDKGGTLVLGGIHMSEIPSLPYSLLYHERVIRSIANNTREDGLDFLQLAAAIPIRTHIEVYPLASANQALCSLKNGVIRGAAVLAVG